jgi:hypothetical protein
MPRYGDSGNGDGGPVDKEELLVKYGSRFFQFCNGNMPLYYVYVVLMKFDLFKSVVSRMPNAATHDSDRGCSSAASVDHRVIVDAEVTPTATGKRRKLKGDTEETPPQIEAISITQTDDQKEICRNQAVITKHRAEMAREESTITKHRGEMARQESIAFLMKAYQAAKEEYDDYSGSRSSFYFKVLTKNVNDLEAKLSDMFSISNDSEAPPLPRESVDSNE